jgi:hypothetical protein
MLTAPAAAYSPQGCDPATAGGRIHGEEVGGLAHMQHTDRTRFFRLAGRSQSASADEEIVLMPELRRRSRPAAVATLLVLSAVLLGLSPGAALADERETAGHVYVLNNNLFGANSITSFARAANGNLAQVGVTDIGGQGSLAAFADGAQRSLIRTPDGRRLFAVDAGSDQISVVDVTDSGLLLVGFSRRAGPVR